MPSEYRLNPNDRPYLIETVKDGQLIQRVANRARALLALDRGERVVEIIRWTNLSRMGVWHLWQRYVTRGVEAIFDGRVKNFVQVIMVRRQASCLQR